MVLRSQETFRFAKENDYEYEISFKVFLACCQKIDIPKFFIVLFFTKKVSTVIVIEGGCMSPFPIAKC